MNWLWDVWSEINCQLLTLPKICVVAHGISWNCHLYLNTVPWKSSWIWGTFLVLFLHGTMSVIRSAMLFGPRIRSVTLRNHKKKVLSLILWAKQTKNKICVCFHKNIYILFMHHEILLFDCNLCDILIPDIAV